MEIEKSVSLVANEVRERMKTLENRKKVLMLGNCDDPASENLCGMFESNGFALCDIESYKKEQDIDKYEFIVIPKSKFKELLQQAKPETDTAGTGDLPSGEKAKCRRIDKRIVTARDIQNLIPEGCREIKVRKKKIITLLAFDYAK